MKKQMVSVKKISSIFPSIISHQDEYNVEYYCIRYIEYEVLNRLKDDFKIRGSFKKPLFEVTYRQFRDLVPRVKNILVFKIDEIISAFKKNFDAKSFNNGLKVISISDFNQTVHYDSYKDKANQCLTDDINKAILESEMDRLFTVIEHCETKPIFVLGIQGTFENKVILFYAD